MTERAILAFVAITAIATLCQLMPDAPIEKLLELIVEAGGSFVEGGR